MRVYALATLAIPFVSQVIALPGTGRPLGGGRPSISPNGIVPNSYILEKECPGQGSDGQLLGGLVDLNLEAAINLNVEALISGLLDLIPGAEITRTYKSEIFCGVATKVPHGTNPEALRGLDGVKSVSPDRYIEREGHGGSLSSSTQQKRDHASMLPKRASRTPEPAVSAYRNSTFIPHTMLRINEMHDRGLVGDPSVKVCLIDDGVDYTNPLLGGCLGEGCHVAFGYDFSGDDGTKHDDDPFTDCAEHGTVTSGIVGGYKDNRFGFSGVAPGVTLGVYRTFPCSGPATFTALIAATLRAARDGCNVVSMSFGFVSGWDDNNVDNPIYSILKRLSHKGIVTVGSAGNNGGEGLFYGRSPSASKDMLSVAAVNPTFNPVGYEMELEGEGIKLAYPSTFPVDVKESLDVVSFPLRANKDGSCNDSKNQDYKNSLILINYADPCYRSALDVVAKGGARVLVWWTPNAKDASLRDFGAGTRPAEGSDSRFPWSLTLFVDQIHTVLNAQKSNKNLKINFHSSKLADRSKLSFGPDGGLVSDYSNWGPTNTLMSSQVEVAGVGTNYLSTFPMSMGMYGSSTGTSFSTPQLTGIAALLLSHRKEDRLTPHDIRSLITTTASPIAQTEGEPGTLESVLKQGSGLANVWKAYNARTFIRPYRLSFNDSATFVPSHELTLKNRNSGPVTYTFSYKSGQAVATYNTSSAVDTNPLTDPLVVDAYAKLTFSPPSITIEAGDTKSITVSVTAPPTSAQLPAYSGWIEIDAVGDKAENYVVPYFGMAGDLSSVKIIDDSTSAGSITGIAGLRWPFISVGQDASMGPPHAPPTSADQIYADDTKTAQLNRTTGLQIWYRLAMPAQRSTIDIVPADTDFVPTISTKDNAGLVKRASTADETFDSVQTVGRVNEQFGSPRDGTSTLTSFAFYGNVTVSPSGVDQKPIASKTPYRILLRVQKLRHDPSLSSSYESWLSPAFEFVE